MQSSAESGSVVQAEGSRGRSMARGWEVGRACQIPGQTVSVGFAYIPLDPGN